MKAIDLRNKSVEDLNNDLLKLRKDQLKLRMQQSTGQLGQSHMVRETRRDIARIKTVLNEKAGTNA
jgi:large subunit ribosomal protein L29